MTGHQAISSPAAWPWVRSEIRRLIEAEGSELTGLSSLAEGSDQVFAEEVLRAGGRLIAVIPFKGYDRVFQSEAAALRYRELRDQAASSIELDANDSEERQFLLAGQLIARSSDRVIAVWDGLPARGTGGTAEIVNYCQEIGTVVTVINPDNLSTFELDSNVVSGE